MSNKNTRQKNPIKKKIKKVVGNIKSKIKEKTRAWYDKNKAAQMSTERYKQRTALGYKAGGATKVDKLLPKISNLKK